MDKAEAGGGSRTLNTTAIPVILVLLSLNPIHSHLSTFDPSFSHGVTVAMPNPAAFSHLL